MKPAEVAFIVDRESFQEIGLQQQMTFTKDLDSISLKRSPGVHSLYVYYLAFQGTLYYQVPSLCKVL